MRACWLKWVGRDWSISADYIWLNYSDANNAARPKYLRNKLGSAAAPPYPCIAITISFCAVLRHHVQDGRGHRMRIEQAFDSMLQCLPTGGFLQSRAHCFI